MYKITEALGNRNINLGPNLSRKKKTQSSWIEQTWWPAGTTTILLFTVYPSLIITPNLLCLRHHHLFQHEKPHNNHQQYCCASLQTYLTNHHTVNPISISAIRFSSHLSQFDPTPITHNFKTHIMQQVFNIITAFNSHSSFLFRESHIN